MSPEAATETKKKAKKNGEKKGMEILRVTSEALPCKLTEEEFRQRSKDLASVNRQIREHEDRAKQVKADLKATEEEMSARRNRLSVIVDNESEMRPVEVEIVADYTKGTIARRRKDTGETFHVRPMEAHERQTTIPGVAKTNGSPKAGPEPLAWESEGTTSVAKTAGGSYCIEFDGNEHLATFTSTAGKIDRIARRPVQAEAVAACESDHLQRAADALLTNAGDGELTKKSLNGEPVAFKK